MDNRTSEFTPEMVDAQVNRLLTRSFPTSQNAQIVGDLQQMYQGDERSLRNVWQRLGLENNQSDSMEGQPEMLSTADIRQQSMGTKVLELERNRPGRQIRKRSLTRVFSLLAVACVAALIVGSMLFISNLVRQNQHNVPATSAPGASQDVYASDYTSMFKLDSQTHQTLWQQPLTGVIKIIPSGKVVYILQSIEHEGTTNAVLALDTSSGKTLWTYTFPAQKQSTGALSDFARDMVLAQDRLYVGWQTEGAVSPHGGNISAAQIFVLNASDGNKLMAYPATDDVWSMVAGAGILVVSVDGGLQGSDLTTGIVLFRISFPSDTNAPVFSLQIANGLVYAVIQAIDGESDQMLTSIRAYKMTSGEQVWQSPTFPGDELSFFTVNQNMVYFGTTLDPQPDRKKPVTGRIYAYDMQDNKQIWSVPIDGVTLHQPVFNAGVIYVGVDSGPGDNISPTQAQVIAINAATGSFKWQQTLTGDYIGGFCLADGAIYASSYTFSQNGIVWEKSYELKASDGTILWKDIPHNFYVIVPAV